MMIRFRLLGHAFKKEKRSMTLYAQLFKFITAEISNFWGSLILKRFLHTLLTIFYRFLFKLFELLIAKFITKLWKRDREKGIGNSEERTGKENRERK